MAEGLALLRDGLVSICESSGRFRVVASAADGEQLLAAIRQWKPDAALADMAVGRLHALEVVRKCREEGLQTRILVTSLRSDRKSVVEALRGGVQGYVLKSGSGEALLDGLDRVLEGGVYVSPQVDLQRIFTEASRGGEAMDPFATLSAREHQVFSMLVEGVRAKEIAARLNLSTKTVDTYRAGLMRKLDIHDVAGLVKYALQRNLTQA